MQRQRAQWAPWQAGCQHAGGPCLFPCRSVPPTSWGVQAVSGVPFPALPVGHVLAVPGGPGPMLFVASPARKTVVLGWTCVRYLGVQERGLPGRGSISAGPRKMEEGFPRARAWQVTGTHAGSLGGGHLAVGYSVARDPLGWAGLDLNPPRTLSRVWLLGTASGPMGRLRWVGEPRRGFLEAGRWQTHSQAEWAPLAGNSCLSDVDGLWGALEGESGVPRPAFVLEGPDGEGAALGIRGTWPRGVGGKAHCTTTWPFGAGTSRGL